ncbi:MAG TPA: efflux RND transporter periplasmic adaptor subunit [Candidatus Angelobacter sp.]|nr:efflux RND transporter periplasmic adaptor subunit [Candidatus Angelobacter sp.]
MNYIKSKWSIITVVLIAVGVLTAFDLESKKAPQQMTAKVQKGDIQNVVQATGSINAVTTVQVGSQVSGTIQKLYADFNSHVTKNEIVAQIDASLFQGALLQAKADLADAQANLLAAKANLEKAQATSVQTKLDYDRNNALAQEGVIAAQLLDAARAAWQSPEATVSSTKAQVTQAAAQVQQKAAAVAVAQTNVDHTTIRSPIDGTVVARNVDVGQTVAASLQAPTLFTIAQDLTKMQVYVSADESDVGAIRPGQSVTFKVDAFPKESFGGKVSAIRLNATTVQNVVTYTAVVDFDNPGMKLFPGMTAYVNIPVATANDVLKVPNGALRYTPNLSADQLNILYQKAGIAPTGGRGKAGKGMQADQQATTAVVWKLAADKSLEPVQIKLGITDHATTEVAQLMKGSLNQGDEVVVGSAAPTQRASGPTSAPGMGGTNIRMGR